MRKGGGGGFSFVLYYLPGDMRDKSTRTCKQNKGLPNPNTNLKPTKASGDVYGLVDIDPGTQLKSQWEKARR